MGFAVMLKFSEDHLDELILDILPQISITKIRYYTTILDNLIVLI
jgi:hypothetical protein